MVVPTAMIAKKLASVAVWINVYEFRKLLTGAPVTRSGCVPANSVRTTPRKRITSTRPACCEASSLRIKRALPRPAAFHGGAFCHCWEKVGLAALRRAKKDAPAVGGQGQPVARVEHAQVRAAPQVLDPVAAAQAELERPGRVLPVQQETQAAAGLVDRADAQRVVGEARGDAGRRVQLAEQRQALGADPR